MIRIKLHTCISIDEDIGKYISSIKIKNFSKFVNDLLRSYINSGMDIEIELNEIKNRIQRIKLRLDGIKSIKIEEYERNLKIFNETIEQKTLLDSNINEINEEQANIKEAIAEYNEIKKKWSKKSKNPKILGKMISDYFKKTKKDKIKDKILKLYINEFGRDKDGRTNIVK